MSDSIDKDNSCATAKEEIAGIKDIIPSHLQWLKFEAPGFSLNGDQIKVLLTPKEFYSAIIKGCQEANHRISLAALYIGMGALEHNLVEVLDDRMTECGKDLSVTVLLDAVRGTRDESAGTLLLPLIRKHQHCQVSMFHNPVLRGLLLRCLPTRTNEAVGVQHIKLYVFDDDVIVSGANLTKEYFTDRQDRYMLISNCRSLADFCNGLIESLCSVSLQLSEDNSLAVKTPTPHPYLSPPGVYVKYAREVVWGYYQKVLKETKKTLKPGHDTWIFPVLQLPPLDVLQDSRVTQTLLECAGSNNEVYFTSPYFNLPEDYIVSLLHKCTGLLKILVPHPTASDFHKAPGLSGHIPRLYRMLAKVFLHRVQDTGQAGRVTVREFFQPEGSYHCKGIWLKECGQDSPYLTLIGSSNFNYRSVKRDLECQLVLITRNPGLSRRLQEEYEHVYRHGTPFTVEVSDPDSQPRLWYYPLLWFFNTFF